MKVVALVSGGKDSCYNMLECVRLGHEIVALANLHPPKESGQDEMDSFTFQTVGHSVLEHYAAAMGVPMYREAIQGTAVNQNLHYVPTETDETEDLYRLLRRVKEKLPDVQGVSVGAILSNYQRTRVENVCKRLGMYSLAFLWERDQHQLYEEMVESDIGAIFIKIAAMGLLPKHLGLSLAQMRNEMHRLGNLYELNMCGEGGEYETMTLDCPLFCKAIHIEDSTRVVHSDDAFAPVAYIQVAQASLEEKSDFPGCET
ncbi:hypothetical protein BJ684DRAFT_22804 [Piptocephalis cylindrospora]|uniref:Diphthine--ammonia ligase n=1 Tax=Piptocephalis cylindrospora TaxID=1907219 RepID=A0A4P9Y3L1_9FUNG|nr:hypothetical protein BJ684DRAFT_22804 [Piptocephalis cylindrospora]|eukprot:RKP13393.1 hypothetical protein BJ684DRAFT_22804 [Piptocephalis cylindrospora]